MHARTSNLCEILCHRIHKVLCLVEGDGVAMAVGDRQQQAQEHVEENNLAEHRVHLPLLHPRISHDKKPCMVRRDKFDLLQVFACLVGHSVQPLLVFSELQCFFRHLKLSFVWLLHHQSEEDSHTKDLVSGKIRMRSTLLYVKSFCLRAGMTRADFGSWYALPLRTLEAITVEVRS